mmetsp:Transcript_40191/g.125262  ORF Transcript_40191/g.125262 Transcript_40191/m.125262 type:complete len:235 (+) Transcript_40191:640-1344(+)
MAEDPFGTPRASWPEQRSQVCSPSRHRRAETLPFQVARRRWPSWQPAWAPTWPCQAACRVCSLPCHRAPLPFPWRLPFWPQILWPLHSDLRPAQRQQRPGPPEVADLLCQAWQWNRWTPQLPPRPRRRRAPPGPASLSSRGRCAGAWRPPPWAPRPRAPPARPLPPPRPPPPRPPPPPPPPLAPSACAPRADRRCWTDHRGSSSPGPTPPAPPAAARNTTPSARGNCCERAGGS